MRILQYLILVLAFIHICLTMVRTNIRYEMQQEGNSKPKAYYDKCNRWLSLVVRLVLCVEIIALICLLIF